MDTLSSSLYAEIIKESHWLTTLNKIETKKKNSTFDFSDLYLLTSENKRKEIAKQICEGSYVWSTPEKLLLAKSGTTKKRTVYMYSMQDRMILGVIYRAFNAYFNNEFAPNCFSYRKGVSTNSAIRYINAKKQNTKMFGLKMDISAYFNSVNREHLNKSLTELFGDTTGIRESLDKLFNNDTVLFHGEEIEEYKSLIPGCALGSFFANYCLKDLDFHFLDKSVIYARYSDDIIILDETEEKINEHLCFIKDKLKEYGLSINEKKYTHFNPEEAVEYLGLSLSDEGVDISNHAKQKLKKTIKRWVVAGRKEIEMEGKSFDKVAKKIVSRLNWKLCKSYIEDESKFGWAFYAFRYITILESLTEIDFYLRDRLRYLKTGKNNKANVKALTDEDFQKLGVVSLYDMYTLFHEDFDYYCEVAYLLR